MGNMLYSILFKQTKTTSTSIHDILPLHDQNNLVSLTGNTLQLQNKPKHVILQQKALRGAKILRSRKGGGGALKGGGDDSSFRVGGPLAGGGGEVGRWRKHCGFSSPNNRPVLVTENLSCTTCTVCPGESSLPHCLHARHDIAVHLEMPHLHPFYIPFIVANQRRIWKRHVNTTVSVLNLQHEWTPHCTSPLHGSDTCQTYVMCRHLRCSMHPAYALHTVRAVRAIASSSSQNGPVD